MSAREQDPDTVSKVGQNWSGRQGSKASESHTCREDILSTQLPKRSSAIYHLSLSNTLLPLLQLYEDTGSTGGCLPGPYCLPHATCLLPASLSFSFPECQPGTLWSRPGCQLGHARYTQWDPCGSLARPESLAHVCQSHSETIPPGPAGRRLCTMDEGSPGDTC